MLKLAQLLANEEIAGLTSPERNAKREAHIRAALKGHPKLTLSDLVRGERDASGNLRPNGYAGWFWIAGLPSSDAQVSRIALGLKCGPRALLADLLQVEA